MTQLNEPSDVSASRSRNFEPVRRLADLRTTLFGLHKALIDSERVSYEKTFGPVTSANHLLQLLTGDPWFAWLQPLSQLVVALDEVIDMECPLSDSGVDALVRRTQALLVASENGEGFARNYFDALQRDPDVVMAHAAVVKHFHAVKPPG